MPTPTIDPFELDVPAHGLATCDRLAEQHARLRRWGVHYRDGGWIAGRPADVAAALTLPTLTVAAAVPAGRPPVGEARVLQARMARFCDGPQHTRRRELLEQLLPAVAGLEAEAAQRTCTALQHGAGAFDVMPLARTVPVVVLAAALGVPTADLSRVPALTGRLCDALAPWLGVPPVEPIDGDQAASQLTALLAQVGPWDDEQVAAAAGLLFQARDATAGLIGAALLADHALVDRGTAGRNLAAGIEWTLRNDAPVQCTRRIAADEVALGGVVVPRGAPVWVVLAAAEQGSPLRPATFGAGPHSCPGAEHAVALASGVLSALSSNGCRLVPGQHVRHEPRTNLRIPAAVLVRQS